MVFEYLSLILNLFKINIKDFAPAENRTRVKTLEEFYHTTRPQALIIYNIIYKIIFKYL